MNMPTDDEPIDETPAAASAVPETATQSAHSDLEVDEETPDGGRPDSRP
jgi:hypothetical protein